MKSKDQWGHHGLGGVILSPGGGGMRGTNPKRGKRNWTRGGTDNGGERQGYRTTQGWTRQSKKRTHGVEVKVEKKKWRWRKNKTVGGMIKPRRKNLGQTRHLTKLPPRGHQTLKRGRCRHFIKDRRETKWEHMTQNGIDARD